MPTKKLTQLTVDAVSPPKSGRIEYFDTLLPGFGLRVADTGHKSWVVMCRVNGRLRRITIDTLARLPKVDEARKRAREIMDQASAGNDPTEAKRKAAVQQAEEDNTVAAVVDRFIERLKEKKRAPDYVSGTRGNLYNHVIPEWGKREIASVDARDVRLLLRAVKDKPGQVGDKGRPRGGPIAANRTLAAIQGLFNFARREGLIDRSPAELAERLAPEEARERTLTDVEMVAVWKAAEAAGYPFGAFFRMALLTGQRRDEVANMRWEDVTLESRFEEREDVDADGNAVKRKVDLGRCWTIPAAMTKSRRAHIVPLSPLAIEILQSLPRKSVTVDGLLKSSPWVFTTGGETAVSGFSKAKISLDGAIAQAREGQGIQSWTIHDLRRTATTKLAENVSEFVIGRVLNHARAGVTGKHYNHYDYIEEKRRALNLWAHRLSKLVNPPPANVVELRMTSETAA